MATAKGGLKVAVNFTPQAQADEFSISEDSVGATGLTDQLMANDGGGAGAQILGITLDSVSAVKANLANYVNLANFANPISTDVDPAAGGHLHLDNLGNVTLSGDFNYLAEGESESLTFTYILRMGNGAFSVTTATIHVTGVNDLATISGANTGEAIEDGAAATGILTVQDLDHDQSHTTAVSGSGDSHLGAFTVDANGHWSYLADHAANDHLAAGVTATDTFTVTSLDGTASETVTVTITGTNDAASIAGDATGDVTEDGPLSTSGTLNVNDVDDGEAHAAAGSGDALHGSYSVDGDGNWTYTVNNDDAAVQALNDGETLTDSFIVWSQDHTDSQEVVITVHGVNEPAPSADVPPPPPAVGGADPNDYDELASNGGDDGHGHGGNTQTDNNSVEDSNGLAGTYYLGTAGNHLLGNSSDDLIYGGSGNDDINGNGGNDTIYGGSGNDKLDGGNGDDTLIGGYGADELIGGSDNDTFVYLSLNDTGDTIKNFNQGGVSDHVDLTALGLTADQVHTYSDVANNQVILWADTNNDPSNAEFMITLTGVTSVTVGDATKDIVI